MEKLEDLEIVELLDRLAQKRDNKHGFLAEFAKISGLDAQNLYKYAKKKAKPDQFTAHKIKKHLDELDSIPETVAEIPNSPSWDEVLRVSLVTLTRIGEYNSIDLKKLLSVQETQGRGNSKAFRQLSEQLEELQVTVSNLAMDVRQSLNKGSSRGEHS